MASLIRSVTSRDPFTDLLRRGSLMDTFFEPVGAQVTARPLPVDVYVVEGGLVVEAALPGVAPSSVSLTVEDGVLTIDVAADSPTEVEDADYRLREVCHGARKRALRVPKNVDGAAATASFEHGLVRITMPLREESRAVRIPLLDRAQTDA